MITTTNNPTTTTTNNLTTTPEDKTMNQIIDNYNEQENEIMNYIENKKKKFKFAVENNLPCKLYINEFRKVRRNWYTFTGVEELDGTVVKFTKYFITAKLKDGSLKRAKYFKVFDNEGNEFLNHNHLLIIRKPFLV